MAARQNVMERVTKHQRLLNNFLAPPLDSTHGHDFIYALRNDVGCESASIFLSQDDPNRLDLIVAHGYKDTYANLKYHLDQDYLTSHVGKHRAFVNKSVRDLERARDKNELPYSGRCNLFLHSKLRNLIAVPILCDEERCIGVLKFENKANLNDTAAFPDEDFEFAKAIAALIGVGHRQRMFGQLWNGWVKFQHMQPRGKRAVVLQGAADLLARTIRSECASIFMRTKVGERDMLSYAAGVGYKKDYEIQRYELGGKAKSFTAYVATMMQPLRLWERELISEKVAIYWRLRQTYIEWQL